MINIHKTKEELPEPHEKVFIFSEKLENCHPAFCKYDLEDLLHSKVWETEDCPNVPHAGRTMAWLALDSFPYWISMKDFQRDIEKPDFSPSIEVDRFDLIDLE